MRVPDNFESERYSCENPCVLCLLDTIRSVERLVECFFRDSVVGEWAALKLGKVVRGARDLHLVMGHIFDDEASKRRRDLEREEPKSKTVLGSNWVFYAGLHTQKPR